LVLTAIAAVLALAAIELLLPLVSAFLEKDLELDYRSDPVALLSLVGITLLVGLAAGSFPAIYVSAFEPAKVLKGDITRGRTAMLFRRILVGAQFSISIGLLIATAVVYRQVLFMRTVDLGYDKEQIVVVSGQRTGRLAERWEVLKREWLAHPQIVAATGSSDTPGTDPGRDLVRGENSDLQSPPVDIHVVQVDFDFFSTYGIDVLAGRAFSRDVGTDARDAETAAPASGVDALGAIVNVRAVRAFGWTPEEAVGKIFSSVPLGGLPGGNPRRIVGVIADIHFQPLQAPIEPMMFVLLGSQLNAASIKVSGRNLEGTLAHIDVVWTRIVPEQPIVRRFLDDDFDAFYRSEQRQGRILAYSSLLAVFLACLGLFGLASLTTEQRTKEIGIRKVMGGSVADIVRLFAGELGTLALLANVIAWPVAYVLMRRWLDNFPYRIELDLPVFVGSGFAVLVIAWLTVGAVAARAAAAKPIHALRCE
jgi:putative ABC transport system permease protein